jgi:hypothetical protein
MQTTRLPELGPWLGRLCAAPAVGPGRAVALDDVRLALATATLDLAGAARDFADGDRAAAVSALRARDWRAAWNTAVATAAERTRAVLGSAFAAAAAESRYPAGRLRQLQVTPDELAAITARLGAGGAAFEAQLARLDELAGAASAAGPGGEAAFARWWTGVTDAARALDSAWQSVEEAAEQEVARWQPEVARVRAWRRPRWLLWLLSAVVLGVAVWLGLMLGGYIPVPGWFRPVAEWWWTAVTFA